jgi:predicted enzyme related to lactoylglutathione lyase
VIIGAHALIYTKNAEAMRAFFRDTLGFPSVDAGRGWLIFALPPAEIAMHPTEDESSHELYLMCDDIDATVAELQRKGVALARPIMDAGFGRVTAIRLPDGEELGLYEPRHPMAIGVAK